MRPSSLKIGFNGRPFLSSKIRGISRYTLELVKELHHQFPDLEIHFFCPGEMNNEIKNEICFAFFHEHLIKPKILWETWYLPRLLKKNKISIYHSTNNVGAPWISDIPILITIHDSMTHIHRNIFSFKSMWGYLNYQIEFYLLKHARFFFTVSHFSKKSIAKTLLLPDDKIKVTYNGVTLPVLNVTAKSSDYYLYVGGLETRKNITFLINALENSSIIIGKKIKLVCISDYSSASKDLQEKIKNSKLNIEIMSGISDLKLVEYYLNAKMVIIPSLEEGFGLPLAEAMRLKIPLAVSRIEIFEEITQRCCYMFDNLNSQELTNLIVDLDSAPDQLNIYVENAYEISLRYSWEVAARETYHVYEELLKN